MSTINFLGISSGLNTKELLESLLELERQPIKRLELNIERSEAYLEIWRDLNVRVNALRSAISPLLQRSTFTSLTASSSNAAVLKTAVSGSPEQGSYMINVEQLATRHSVAMAAPASLIDDPSQSLGLFGSFYLSTGAPVEGLDTLLFDDSWIRGNAAAGYHAVVDGSEGTAYSLLINELAFAGGYEGQEIRVYLQDFTDSQGNSLVEDLQNYHTGKGWTLPDEVYSGEAPVMIIKQDGGGNWQTYAADGTSTPFTFLGDHPLGNFTLKSEIVDGTDAVLATHTFDFQVTDQVPTAGLITVEADDSLHSIAQKINAGTAETGVTAAVVKVTDGDYRLVLESQVDGEQGTIQAWSYSPLDAAGEAAFGTGDVLRALAILEEAPAGGVGSQYTYVTGQAADARLTVNGLAVERGQNQIADLIDGVTLSLEGTGSAMLTVETDVDSAMLAVTEFVTAYNELNNVLRELLKVDMTSEGTGIKEVGALQGDSRLIAMQSNLRKTLFNRLADLPGQELSFNTLTELGITTADEKGMLVIDEQKLRSALREDAEGVYTLFARSTEGNEGILRQMNSLTGFFSGSGGPIAGRERYYQTLIGDYQKQIERQELRMEMMEKRLLRQFSYLETYVSSRQWGADTLASYLAEFGKNKEDNR